MGRGDRKTRKGKRSIASYGKTRSHTSRAAKKAVGKKPATKTGVRPAAPAVKRPAAPAKKAPAKKAGA